jgi:hypothetical protein
MFVCCECCVLSGRGHCDELITRPDESYRLWCVVVCDLENLKNEEAMIRVGKQRHKKKIFLIIHFTCKLLMFVILLNLTLLFYQLLLRFYGNENLIVLDPTRKKPKCVILGSSGLLRNEQW